MEAGLNSYREKINFSWQQLHLQALPISLLPASHRVDPQKIKVCLTPRSGYIPFISGRKQGERDEKKEKKRRERQAG